MTKRFESRSVGRYAVLIAALLLLIGLFIVVNKVERTKSRRALATYLAGLRAQGEPLTWEDLGYPPADTNTSLDAFLAAVGRLGAARPQPGELEHMHFVGPGEAVAGWSAQRPQVHSNSRSGTNAPSWTDFLADMRTFSNALAELRVSLDHPPRHFAINLTNPLAAMPKSPFVQKRNAAQWLAADSLAASREEELNRAQADLHALTQLAQLHRDDPTLVSAMIRVAISGLGLAATWDALQAEGWSEASLEVLQRDWEAIDLLQALERGIVGERIWVLQLFEDPKLNAATVARTGGGAGSSSGLEVARDFAVDSYWRSHREEDELQYVKLKQERLDIIRRLQANEPGYGLLKEMDALNEELESMLESPFTRFRYLLTAIAMPNYGRAVSTVMRHETQRRMTVTAVALKRHHLANGSFPPTLSALVPGFLSAVPMDPLSGQPLCYRSNADGSFTLYSVGEDGVDDGGDPMSAANTNSFGLWVGKDAVWPRAVAAPE